MPWNNNDRAASAEEALKVFQAQTGSEDISDLICNLLHLASRRDESPIDAMRGRPWGKGLVVEMQRSGLPCGARHGAFGAVASDTTQRRPKMDRIILAQVYRETRDSLRELEQRGDGMTTEAIVQRACLRTYELQLLRLARQEAGLPTRIAS